LRPSSAWRRVTLRSLTRTYRTPRVFDERIRLRDYGDKPIRQLSILGLNGSLNPGGCGLLTVIDGVI